VGLQAKRGEKNPALRAIYFLRWTPRWRSALRQKAFRRQAMAFFPGRRLPARENIISSVASVPPW
ncbi:MAG: hypothetical protein WBH05_07375, partial [Syntrophobacteria bacterium]